MSRGKQAFLGLAFLAVLWGPGWSASLNRPPGIITGKPKTQRKTHKVGNMWVTTTNFGFFGNQGVWSYPSCEFPARSGIEYLFQGGLWFGTMRPKPGQPGKYDTLVTTGCEGWAGYDELWPGDSNADTIIERSTRPGSPYYADSTSPYGKAVSEQDFIAASTDTNTNPAYVGPDHKPLGIKVFQKSYAWSYTYAQNFILIDYELINIGRDTLRNLYMGLYVDADCGASGASHENPKAQDDVCGFRRWRSTALSSDTLWPTTPEVDSVVFFRRGLPPEHVEGRTKKDAPSEQINVAWIADASGDGITDPWPTPSVTGVRVLRTPNPRLTYSFQWWYSDSDPAKDWGPHDPNERLDPEGTPNTDAEKFCIMSLAKWHPSYAFDPDQLDPQNGSFATYEDTRYLLSVGPVYPGWRDPTGQDTTKQYLAPGDTVPITVGYCGGLKFHKGNAPPPKYGWPYDPYYDFADLALSASWAYRVYDNPGIDTDGDGYRGTYAIVYKAGRGDTTWLEGDGIPDFRGPPPPYPPNIKTIPANNKVTLIWDASPEDPKQQDPFSKVNDFEGYKVYRSFTTDKQEIGGWTLLGQYDQPLSNHDTTIAYKYGFDNWPPPPISPGLKAKYTDRDYRYMLEDVGVPNGFPVYYAVTAVDFGYKPSLVEPLESSPNSSLMRVIPGSSVEEAQALEVMVVPNPYRIDGGKGSLQDYNEMRWENPDRKTWSEHTRRLDFINLPEKCVIRIYSLGGDLVATIFHPTGDSYSTPTSERWNLISRDLQAVSTGVYLFSIAGTDGKVKQVGKFVVIK
jgi:hypothetical protein